MAETLSPIEQVKLLKKQQESVLAEKIKKLREPLVTKIAEIKKTLKKEERELKKLDETLGGTPVKKKAPAKKEGTGKPKATDEQCLSALTQILKDNGTLTVEEVTLLAKDKLAEKSIEMRGLSNRLPKMLKTAPFALKGEKVTLTKAKA